ncbi:MAG: formyltetrahydrofolate deformylase [Verrucomicrobiota bacterium]
MNTTKSAILLIHCADKRGLVEGVADFILRHNGNILHFDQHVDREKEVFFMRAEWDLSGFDLEGNEIATCFDLEIGRKFEMQWKLHFSDEKIRMAIFVSKISHCLYDLLARVHSGIWDVDIPLIISNHPDLETVARNFDIPYHLFPMSKANRNEQEAKQIRLLADYKIDLVVLARYMQILSSDFIKEYPNRIINIHHSFLPAFAGAKPYHAAYERGVKIIGATSHYVTEELDAGPIIEQDVAQVNHRYAVEDMIREGQDLEKVVLSRAVYAHIKRRILVYDNRTVVF